MKTTMMVFLAVTMCACGSSQSKPKMELHYSDPAENLPPTDFEMAVGDHRTPAHTSLPAPVVTEQTEQARYEESMKGINQTFADETLQLMMCVDEYKKPSERHVCVDLKKKLCEITELIDSKGNRHPKPYCWR